MASLVEARGWVFFDILASDAARGARVAMWLRAELPGATIRSEPEREPSPDPALPHLLRCRACRPGVDAAATRGAIEAALARLDQAAGGGARWRVHFHARPGAAARAA